MQDRILSINNIKIAARQSGDPNGPFILALHGWLDNLASFTPITPYLSRYNLLSFDFPGHGLSDHFSSDLPYHFIDAVIHMMLMVQQQQWQRIILLGHSMGGAIATLLAGLIPDKIEKLIVIEGLGPLTENIDSAPQQILGYLRRYQKLLPVKPRYYENIEACAKVRAQKGTIRFEDALLLAARGTEQTEQGWTWRHDTKLYLPSPIRLTEEQVLSFLTEITAPTCLITAEDGFHYDPCKIDGRLKAIREIETHMTAGGHHCHMEYPKVIAELIEKFIQS